VVVLSNFKINDFVVGDFIVFSFIGEKKTGIVIEVYEKLNKLKVKTKNGMYYQVRLSDKESEFCFIIKKNN
jgi:hypothetical protein